MIGGRCRWYAFELAGQYVVHPTSAASLVHRIKSLHAPIMRLLHCNPSETNLPQKRIESIQRLSPGTNYFAAQK